MAHDTERHRVELIADLRAFADLLERRPDMPINEYDRVKVQYSITEHFSRDEAVRVAEVERIAELLGVDVQRDKTFALARLDLGLVEYLVHANTDYGDAAFNAVWSYNGAVEPDLVSQ